MDCNFWLLWLAPIPLIAGGAILMKTYGYKGTHDRLPSDVLDNTGKAVASAGALFAIIMLIVSIIFTSLTFYNMGKAVDMEVFYDSFTSLTFYNMGKAVDMEVFYDSNVMNYQISVDDVTSYLSAEEYRGALVQGSIEKLVLASTVANMTIQWRDAVNVYNSQLAWFERMDHNPFIGFMYPTVTDYLKPLIIRN